MAPEEPILAAAYEEEAECYARALAFADLLVPALSEGADLEPLMKQLVAALEPIQGIEKRIAAAKNQWRVLGHTPGEALRSVLQRVGELIQRLRQGLDSAQAQAIRIQDSMKPGVDRILRGKQMRRAYGRTFEK